MLFPLMLYREVGTPPLMSLSFAWAFCPNIRGVFIKVDLVDYPAKPKFKSVPLLNIVFESRETPRFNFCLFDKIVLGVALNLALEFVLKGFSSLMLIGVGISVLFLWWWWWLWLWCSPSISSLIDSLIDSSISSSSS